MAVSENIYYDFFDFRLDVGKQQLLKNCRPVQLSPKAFQILLLLIRNSGQTTKKEDIFEALWSNSFIEDANLTQQIYVLRKTLGQKPDGQSFIVTVPKEGYSFNLSAEEIITTTNVFRAIPETENGNHHRSPPDENSEIENAETAHLKSFLPKGSEAGNDNLINGNATKTTFPACKNKMSSRRKIGALIMLLFFGTAMIAASIYYLRQNKQQADAVEQIRTIAVLPFKPLGSETDKEKLGLGMADAIITKLGKLQQIAVRPTSAIFRYTDHAVVDADAAGRELGVDAVLEGTVQCDGEHVQVTVQLVRVNEGKPIWAESFKERVFDVFDVQDAISTKVASSLSINLTLQQQALLTRH